MTMDLRASAVAWLAARRPAVVVEVLRAQGSVPREAGTRMLVAADTVLGTIGGGHLELKAIASARRMLAGSGAVAEPSEQHYPLGPALGQCCGGAVTLRLLPLADAQPAQWHAEPPRFTLQLYGAGHVGRAIVQVLEGLPCRVHWIDERDSEFPATPSATHIERVCVEPVEAEVDIAPPGAFYLVLTHSHDLDMAITEAILRRGDFAFLGLIGSATKRARFLRRFEARGIPADTLARMTCPIGLPGIEGKEPAVIAVAVVAQLLARSSQAGAATVPVSVQANGNAATDAADMPGADPPADPPADPAAGPTLSRPGPGV
jgi:xanthine dehydrogenase accessory factor